MDQDRLNDACRRRERDLWRADCEPVKVGGNVDAVCTVAMILRHCFLGVYPQVKDIPESFQNAIDLWVTIYFFKDGEKGTFGLDHVVPLCHHDLNFLFSFPGKTSCIAYLSIVYVPYTFSTNQR